MKTHFLKQIKTGVFVVWTLLAGFVFTSCKHEMRNLGAFNNVSADQSCTIIIPEGINIYEIDGQKVKYAGKPELGFNTGKKRTEGKLDQVMDTASFLVEFRTGKAYFMMPSGSHSITLSYIRNGFGIDGLSNTNVTRSTSQWTFPVGGTYQLNYTIKDNKFSWNFAQSELKLHPAK